MLYYSEITNKLYKTEDELKADETELKSLEKQKEVLEKQIKETHKVLDDLMKKHTKIRNRCNELDETVFTINLY